MDRFLCTYVFPGVEFENESFEELNDAIKVSIQPRGLQHSDFITIKTIQLYLTIFIRHRVMLVGATGRGKATSCNLLADALQVIATPVEQKELNLKAITLTDLYGAYNLATGDWKNGLIGNIVSEMAEAYPAVKQWMIFDGRVDAVWIENINIVLDDNKLLFLTPSGRIKTGLPTIGIKAHNRRLHDKYRYIP
jgi:dynein heavy chain